jgi:hypothetical protein
MEERKTGKNSRGSYVYLRRIFERLIKGRFDEFKETEKWSEEDFLKVRMHERIELLKEHLPEFLVRNKKVYSILSLGVHELDEKVCLFRLHAPQVRLPCETP